MSEVADSEELLQVFSIEYDPQLLANHRVTFALLLRQYLNQANCLDEEILVGPDGKADLSHPTHSIIRVCLESAWADLKSGEKWGKYDKTGGKGGRQSKSCGSCKSSCSD
ncbi:hypothetical protein [Paenibacillus durus]|uniref:Uncharacterized protein n=2 Tax=Paenibacillus TaxID=44249 RepID=A0A089HN41_PAEDU|nr:hypothetical protein [Paenibacillus durus]AIQ12502.1 hypothetical protein PDUR_11775 [Paenibacillus durus]